MSGILFGRTRRGPQASSSGLGATLGPTKNMGLGARVAMPQYSQEILEAQMENEPAKLFHVLQDCEGPDRSIEAREKIQGLWVEGGRRGQTAEVSFPHGIHIPPPLPDCGGGVWDGHAAANVEPPPGRIRHAHPPAQNVF